MKICLIGNSGLKNNLKDGQTTKFRLYKKKIEDEGHETLVVDLENFFQHPFSIFILIKKTIKKSDRIVLISGHRACYLLIPYIIRINRKLKKTFVLPVVGSGLLHYSLRSMTDTQIYNFYINKDFSLGKKAKKIHKLLSNIDKILLETSLLKDVYESFYNLSNCSILNNFREQDREIKPYKNKGPLKIIYLSRIISIKGIFDLLEVASSISLEFVLDIYGSIYLSEKENTIFKSFLNNKISYKGQVSNDEVIATLNKYDLFVFPTRYLHEGTPGVISESLIACTPVLSSNFIQASYLLKNGFDSILFNMFDTSDLKEKLIWCILNVSNIRDMKNDTKVSGGSFTYNFNRPLFLKYVLGLDYKQL